MAQDIMTHLIASHAEEMDSQLGKVYPDIFPPSSPSPPSSAFATCGIFSRKQGYGADLIFRDEESKEDIFQLSQNFCQLSTFENPSENHEQSSKKPFKNKKICKRFNNTLKPTLNDNRKGLSKTNGYPTKNFLPNFKGPHLQFLQKYLGKSVIEKNPFIKELREKNGISMQDYQRLYRTKEYTEAFEKMFKSRHLYRELLLSRCNKETRHIHQQKIYVFERAFYEQKFERIN